MKKNTPNFTLASLISLSIIFFQPLQVFSQAPNIHYYTPSIYTVGTAIVPIYPGNTGGAVPATVYGQVSTFAGNGAAGAVNGTATAASFNDPQGIATDAAGNVYVADAGGNIIRKITPSGVVTTFAGNGTQGNANGTGTAASFSTPSSVATDVLGNVYVADNGNYQIRQITPAGVVTTFAGSGTAGNANGTGTAASFFYPTGFTTDATGNLYVADRNNNLIREITPGGVVTTIAGSGTAGSTNGTGTAASFSNPSGVAIDAAGNIYVADRANSLIRKITAAGVVTTFAGSGVQGSADGTGVAASFLHPTDVATDAAGNIYVADYGNFLIRKITPAGVVTTLAGYGQTGSNDGIGAAARFNGTNSLATDAAGNVYVADENNNLIRKIITTGYTISPALPAGLNFDATTGIISGTPTASSPATRYTITAYNTAGTSTVKIKIIVNNIPVAAPAIAYITPKTFTNNILVSPFGPANKGGAVPPVYGKVTTFAGSGTVGNANGAGTAASFNSLSGIARDAAGNFYVADFNGNQIRKIAPDGTVSTLAGNGSVGIANGQGTAASFSAPMGIAIDAANNIYVADYGNDQIRKITPSGLVSNFVTGLNGPSAIAFDQSGNLYEAEGNGSVVNKISPAGAVTVAATGFLNPFGLAISKTGIIYIADFSNRIFMLDNSGVATVFAGSGSPAYADGIGNAASFNNPNGITIDLAGNLYVADTNNGLIREISPAGVVTTFVGNSAFYFFLVFDASGNLYATNGTLISKIAITNGYAISPALPSGLSFDGTSGIISGTPAVLSPATNYTITANNVGGSNVTNLSIAVVPPISSDATLSNLAISTGTLTPAFASGTIAYAENVGNATTSVTVIPTVNDANATVTVNGTALPSGTASSAINLSVGSNTITTTVTAQDGITIHTYTITVNRAASSIASLSDLAVSTGSISPAFASGTTNYTTNVPNTTTSVTVTPAVTDPTANITVNGNTVTSASPSNAIGLTVGANAITVLVTAQDGTTTATYTIVVNRAAPAIATLSNLTPGAGTLSPAFSSGTTAYIDSVANNIASITLTPTATDGKATIQVNGTAVTSGSPSGAIALNVGSNTITTVITAQDGITTDTYTITVDRSRADQIITFNALPTAKYSDPDLDPAATVSSRLPIVYTSSNSSVATIVNNKLHIIGIGTSIITANVAGNAAFLPAIPKDQVLSVDKGNQLISTESIPVLFPGATFALSDFSTSSGLKLNFAVDDQNILTLSGDTIKGDKIGTATLTISQPGDNFYNAAVSKTIEVSVVQSSDTFPLVHKGVSPNGDGKNDFLFIEGIENYVSNHITLFSRNGVIIYDADNYDNKTVVFDGHSNKTGEYLQAGTYFFSIKYSDNGKEKTKTGFFVLKY